MQSPLTAATFRPLRGASCLNTRTDPILPPSSLATTRREKAVKDIVAWLAGDPAFNDYEDYEARPPADCVLNVAGSRESKSPGIADAVEAIMVDVLREVNPDCRKFYPQHRPKRKKGAKT